MSYTAQYITILQTVQETNRIIGFNSIFMVDWILQVINTVLIITIVCLVIYIFSLSIKALKIYIKKNS